MGNCFFCCKYQQGVDAEASLGRLSMSGQSAASGSTIAHVGSLSGMSFTVTPVPRTNRNSMEDQYQHLQVPTFSEQFQLGERLSEVFGSGSNFMRQFSLREQDKISSGSIHNQLQVDLQMDLERDLDPPISRAQWIGGGAFGEVYKTYYQGRPVAVKIFYERHQEQVNNAGPDEFTKELEIICRLKNDYIVEFIGASRSPGQNAIVMEFVESSLYSFIRKPRDGHLPLNVILVIIKDIAKALHYLHQKFAHADLHSENVLIADRIPKLVDFNLSKLMQHKSEESLEHGAPAYAAPELFTKKKISRRSDIYSLAMLALEMWTTKSPWAGYGYYAIIENVSNGNRPQIPENMPPVLKNLIKKCWVQNRWKRPNAKQVYVYCKQVLRQIEKRERFQRVVSRTEEFLKMERLEEAFRGVAQRLGNRSQ